MATVAKTVEVRSSRSLAGAKVREALVGYGFILLPMSIFAIWYLYPLGYAIYISFFDWGVFGKLSSVGTRNYDQLFHDQSCGKALKITLLYTGVVVPSQMALGLSVALVVNAKIKAKTFFRAAFYFPSLASSAAITAIAIYILNADGLLNRLVVGHRSWFGDEHTALWSILGLNAWATTGAGVMFFLPGPPVVATEAHRAAGP